MAVPCLREDVAGLGWKWRRRRSGSGRRWPHRALGGHGGGGARACGAAVAVPCLGEEVARLWEEAAHSEMSVVICIAIKLDSCPSYGANTCKLVLMAGLRNSDRRVWVKAQKESPVAYSFRNA
ncbi:hypothetical protein E2562_019398 [Oryza meyeriana var. granulata]|uniref:Uncharacterized protein n=1 Tax=Oryza meyeriana var. granulata TaxID=110450 RepID=A0A6G1BM73_9ORYZ|nr:hypothetical protein E2562_019398 [Oryza meyeriana var. granulata]